jgi:hypothetical protein
MVAGQKVKGDIFWLRVDYLIMFWIKAWLFLITLVLSIGLYRGYLIFQHSASSPFDYASTHNYWIPDPADPTGVKHIVPPSFTISDGDPLPIGRTLTLNRTVFTDIYKEVDCGHGQVWPIVGGTSDRVLVAGTQDRISPSVITLGKPLPPIDHACHFRVWFTVYRNALLDPLPVELAPVTIYFKPHAKAK